jgi:hypothetical protein
MNGMSRLSRMNADLSMDNRLNEKMMPTRKRIDKGKPVPIKIVNFRMSSHAEGSNTRIPEKT